MSQKVQNVWYRFYILELFTVVLKFDHAKSVVLKKKQKSLVVWTAKRFQILSLSNFGAWYSLESKGFKNVIFCEKR